MLDWAGDRQVKLISMHCMKY